MEGVRGAVLVAAVLWAGGAMGAFIDNRPVMPRSPLTNRPQK